MVFDVPLLFQSETFGLQGVQLSYVSLKLGQRPASGKVQDWVPLYGWGDLAFSTFVFSSRRVRHFSRNVINDKYEKKVLVGK